MADNDLSTRREVLQSIRDELRLQIHLGNAELRDRFEEAERKWHHLEGRMAALGETAQEEAKDIGDAVHLLMDEIREGYEFIRKRL